MWSVTGAVRNVRDEPVTAPPIRISLFDGAGKPVANLVADVLNARVPPGAVRYFAVTLPEPPANAEELEVSFQPRSAAAPTEGAPLAAATLAPEPAEAQALPSDSPHALEKHVQP